MKAKKGISLIVLVITIVVIIILAGAVILSLNQNNPIDQARIATQKSDQVQVQSAVTLYLAKIYAQNTGVIPDADQLPDTLSDGIKAGVGIYANNGTSVWGTTGVLGIAYPNSLSNSTIKYEKSSGTITVTTP